MTWMLGSDCTRCSASMSARLISLPVASPPAWAMRSRWWPPSRVSRIWPSASRSNSAPSATSSRTRWGPSVTRARTAATSHRPTPATRVSSRCSCGESAGSIAAAIPPWAQAVDPSLSTVLVTSRTVSTCSRSRSAAVSPAMPEPTTMTSAEVVQPGAGASSQRGTWTTAGVCVTGPPPPPAAGGRRVVVVCRAVGAVGLVVLVGAVAMLGEHRQHRLGLRGAEATSLPGQLDRGPRQRPVGRADLRLGGQLRQVLGHRTGIAVDRRPGEGLVTLAERVLEGRGQQRGEDAARLLDAGVLEEPGRLGDHGGDVVRAEGERPRGRAGGPPPRRGTGRRPSPGPAPPRAAAAPSGSSPRSTRR